MPERAFLTELWDTAWFQEWTRDQRHLFIYLKTNGHCTQAGVYYITAPTIAFEAKFPQDELPQLLQSLEPHVQWYPAQNIVWVKDFIKEQTKSPKFLVAVARRLAQISNNGLVKAVIDYNFQKYSISIPYEYDTDRVSVYHQYDTDTPLIPDPLSLVPNADTEGKDKEIGKGEKETSVVPKGAGDSHRAEDDEVMATWRSVKGWSLTPDEELELLSQIRTEFPEFNLLDESKAWAARKLSEPLKPNSKPSQQVWNWMRNARKFAQEKGESENSQPPRESFDFSVVASKARQEAERIWAAALEELRNQVNAANYKTWLTGTKGILYKNGVFYVGTPNGFIAEYLEKNQMSLIQRTLGALIHSEVFAEVHVHFVVINTIDKSDGKNGKEGQS